MKRALLKWLLVVLVLAAFVTFVWPTIYRYDHLSVDNSVYPVRINRVTGNADMLVPDEGWVPVEGDAGSTQEQNVQHRAAAGS